MLRFLRLPINGSDLAGGQRRVRQTAGRQEGRRKRRRPAAESFVDGAAGESIAGEDGLDGRAAVAALSQDQLSDYSNGSQDSDAPSDGCLDPEDGYAEEDWEELQQAEAGAADADAMSEDSLLGQAPALTAGSPLQDAEAGQQAASMDQRPLNARHEPQSAVRAVASAVEGDPAHGELLRTTFFVTGSIR